MATNITFHEGSVSHQERTELLGQQGATIWLTGLSASGKSTIATALEQHLLQRKLHAFRLDGDNVRFGLNKGPRIRPYRPNREHPPNRGSLLLFSSSATLTITAFISPYISDRQLARKLHDDHKPSIRFIEVFVDAPLSVVEKRDPKGLYQKARAGEIKEFTGISAPYEAPTSPEIHIRTDEVDVAQACQIIVDYLEKENLIPKSA